MHATQFALSLQAVHFFGVAFSSTKNPLLQSLFGTHVVIPSTVFRYVGVVVSHAVQVAALGVFASAALGWIQVAQLVTPVYFFPFCSVMMSVSLHARTDW